MTEYVLLTDDDNGSALIRCADQEEAESVGAAAVFSDGGVSAWLLPSRALCTNIDDLRELLRDGNSTFEIHEAHDASDYADITLVSTKHLKALLAGLAEIVQEDLDMIDDLPAGATQETVEAANLILALTGLGEQIPTTGRRG